MTTTATTAIATSAALTSSNAVSRAPPGQDIMTQSVYGLSFDDDEEPHHHHQPVVTSSQIISDGLTECSSTSKKVSGLKKYLDDDDEDDDEHSDSDTDAHHTIGNRDISNASNTSFQFDMPFSDLSPLQFSTNAAVTGGGNSPSKKKQPQQSLQHSAQRKLNFNNLMSANKSKQQQYQRKLYFNTKNHDDSDDEDCETGSTRHFDRQLSDDDDDDGKDDVDLLKDFDIIDVIPGFGEPPKSNQEYEIKCLRKKNNQTYRHYSQPAQPIEIREDHFKKPLTKIDVLKAPDNYPCPLNSYCIQEISLNWFLYGGSDFLNCNTNSNASSLATNNTEISADSALETSTISSLASDPLRHQNSKMSRTVSSPIMVNPVPVLHHNTAAAAPRPMINRSRNNSTSSNSLSMSPHYQSPRLFMSTTPTNSAHSPSISMSTGGMTKFSTKTASLNFMQSNRAQSAIEGSNSSAGKGLSCSQGQRKTGGRLINKFDLSSLNWLNRGGRNRNLDLCMEIALHKVKTKIDLFNDDTTLAQQQHQQQTDDKGKHKKLIFIKT